MAQTFDAIVIGAGPAGEVAAGRLAERGRAVALVERELVGGECSYWACMPSKTLLRPGELLDEVWRVPGIPDPHALDVDEVLRRRDEVIHELRDEAQMPWLRERGIALLRGRARLAGERRVSSRSGATRAPRISASRRSDWSRGSRSRSTTRCGCRGSPGSMRSATSTAARC